MVWRKSFFELPPIPGNRSLSFAPLNGTSPWLFHLLLPASVSPPIHRQWTWRFQIDCQYTTFLPSPLLPGLFIFQSQCPVCDLETRKRRTSRTSRRQRRPYVLTNKARGCNARRGQIALDDFYQKSNGLCFFVGENLRFIVIFAGIPWFLAR